MNKITIPCQVSKTKPPEYSHEGDSGADLCAAIEYPITLYPDMRLIIPTGFRVAIPQGYEMQIRSRSGLAAKGIIVANSPGTIDSGYRAEIGVILENRSDLPFIVENGMRIAQAVIAPVMRAVFEIVETLPDSSRGLGGFGSTAL